MSQSNVSRFFSQIMQHQQYSPTEGLLIIEMPGRGVSLRRVGKSGRKCGHKDGKVQFIELNRTGLSKPTPWRRGYEITRELEAIQNTCHQIVNIREELAHAWANEAMSDELVRTANGKKFVPKYKPEQRFTMRLNEHFLFICEQHMIRPSRCSWTFEATFQSTDEQ